MRRKERQMTDLQQIQALLPNFTVCRLGLVENNTAYIVPMNFGFEWLEDTLILYLHSAREGKKMAIIQNTSRVAFEMDGEHALLPGETACDYSYAYASMMGEGVIAVLQEEEQKRHALTCILKHYDAQAPTAMTSAQIAAVALLQITVDAYTVKANQIARRAEEGCL